MKWKINFKQNDQIESNFDSWQIYCENQDGEKLKSILLPQNITEYLFTNLGKYLALYDDFFMNDIVYVKIPAFLSHIIFLCI